MTYDATAAAWNLAAEIETNGITVDGIAEKLRHAYLAGRRDAVPEPLPESVDTRLAMTQRQGLVLDFVAKHIDEMGNPPTTREIARALGINSTNGVIDHLRLLERKGYIRRSSFKSRSIQLIDWPKRTILGELRKLGAPEFPVDWALLVCAQAADHLEHVLDWDGHGWEVVRTAVRVAAAYLDNRMPTEVEFSCGPATPSVEALRSRPAFGSRHGE
jgi:hypothetical protein